jgi:hypothetical protein
MEVIQRETVVTRMKRQKRSNILVKNFGEAFKDVIKQDTLQASEPKESE